MKNKNVKYNLLGYLLFLIIGMAIGWLLFHRDNGFKTETPYAETTGQETIWTCTDHPEIREMGPGKCPKCSKELVLYEDQDSPDQSSIDTASVYFSGEELEMEDIQTEAVTRKNPVKVIRLNGMVQVNDRYKVNQTATIGGRVETLFVYSTGEHVKKGQTLALIYSPELVAAQQALLDAAQAKAGNPAAYDMAKERLRKWKWTDEQIRDIEKLDRVKNNFEVTATVSGVVSAIKANTGDYVHAGEVLYQVTDFSKLWVVFDANESDIPFLHKGDLITFSFKSNPGENLTAGISYVESAIHAGTRVSKVRVELDNPSGKIRPGMYAVGRMQENLTEYRNMLVIPDLSVLWSGKRSLVYVRQDVTKGIAFKLREVKLGPMLGDSYVVINGLNDGEEIVTQGVSSVNTAAKHMSQSNH